MELSETCRGVDIWIELGGWFGFSQLFMKVYVQIWGFTISMGHVFCTLAPLSLQLSMFGADEACGIHQI